MSALKLSEMSDEELAMRLLRTTGRLEPHCAELARRLLGWCGSGFVVSVSDQRIWRMIPDGKGCYTQVEMTDLCDWQDLPYPEAPWWEHPDFKGKA